MPLFQTEHDRVYGEIWAAIISRELKPGERLPQRKIAERYGTTAVTIREVFRSLENSGLIVMAPKWGAVVVQIDTQMLRGKYIVREALEGMAARLLAEGVDETSRREIEEAAIQCDKTLLSEEIPVREKARVHFSFHERFVAGTKCNELIELVSKINLFAILLSNTYHIDWTLDVPHAHEKLVHNVLSNPPDVAERFARKAVSTRVYQRSAGP